MIDILTILAFKIGKKLIESWLKRQNMSAENLAHYHDLIAYFNRKTGSNLVVKHSNKRMMDELLKERRIQEDKESIL